MNKPTTPHAHCKCMNLDGSCPNYHYATCPELLELLQERWWCYNQALDEVIKLINQEK